MRALIDAGQFSNLPGGFKARGVRIVGDQDPISPGEWREVESTGRNLIKVFMLYLIKSQVQLFIRCWTLLRKLDKSLLIQQSR